MLILPCTAVYCCVIVHTPVQVRIELYDRKQTKFISAHNTPLVCLTLSMDGKRLATASDKGTLVRVWNTADGQLLQVRPNPGRGGGAAAAVEGPGQPVHGCVMSRS
jgi:WD40 repeat protein